MAQVNKISTTNVLEFHDWQSEELSKGRMVESRLSHDGKYIAISTEQPTEEETS